MKLHFLGANRQVTGSRYLLEAAGLRIMIDCGMFQERFVLERNWETSPIPPGSIDCMLLTHAHLDHVGLVPRLVAAGFDKPIYTTEPTVDLAAIIMRDSARIQEEDAAYKRKRHAKEGRKSPRPVEPLYTIVDAERAIPLLKPVRYGQPVQLGEGGPGVAVTFHDAGHILGSAILELTVRENGSTRRVVFSGDLGQDGRPLVHDPSVLEQADYLVMESTYGDRNHRDEGDPEDRLAQVVNDTVARGGNVVIPTFAMERAQELMYHFSRLRHQNRIPDVPIYLDSPMAIDVTDVFRKYRSYLDSQTHELIESGHPPMRFKGLHFSRTTDQSKAINEIKKPAVIMSTSGMCTGGRIKHHLRQNVGRRDSTVLFVGYQAVGTLGRQLLDRPAEVRILGQVQPLRATIEQIHGFSGHADRDDLLRWASHFKQAPRRLFLTHGEYDAATSLKALVEDRLKWRVDVPEYRDVATLD